jgi:hypothetical protein
LVFLKKDDLSFDKIKVFLTLKTEEVNIPDDPCLVNYWPIFNGNMSDIIGTAHMSQGSSTLFTLDRFGIANSALALNGGYTQVPSGYYFNTPQFSVSAWVYPSTVGSWARIFDFANSGPYQCIQLSFTSYATNSPAFVIYDQTTNVIGSTQSKIPLEQNKWNFITMTYNGSQLSLFINGSLVNSTQVLLSQIPKVQRINNFFGKSNWPNNGVSSSYLDEIRFYNISLTQTQIIDLMNENGQINSFSACPYLTTTSSTSTTPTSTSTPSLSSSTVSTSTSTTSTVTSTTTTSDLITKDFLTIDHYIANNWSFDYCQIIDQIGLTRVVHNEKTIFIENRYGCPYTALSLNGGWIQVSSGVYFNTREFSITLWVYPLNVGNFSRVLDFGNGPNSDSIILALSQENSLMPYFAIFSQSTELIKTVSSQSLFLGQWQLLVATFNGTNARIYLNGQLTTLDNPIDTSLILEKNLYRNSCFIGKSDTQFVEQSNSYIDDLRFYNKSLTHTEIYALMNENQSSSKKKKVLFMFQFFSMKKIWLHCLRGIVSKNLSIPSNFF